MDRIKLFFDEDGKGGGGRGGSQDEDEFSGKKALNDAKKVMCFTLTWRQRLYGFAGFMCLGFLMTLLAWVSFPDMISFAIFYTLGNFVGITSSCFLLGPVKQVKRMFNRVRITATCVFFVFMGLTLYAALGLKSIGLTILFCLVQYVALIWYCLSYIPYARKLAKNCLGKLFAA